MNLDLTLPMFTVPLALVVGGVLGWRLRAARSVADRPVPETVSLWDAQTGLYSREAGLDALTRQLYLADRLGHAVTVLVVEVDGQAAGLVPAPVVTGVSRRLARRVRKYDVLSRWGEGRFLIISSDADVGSALVLAQDLVEAVGAAPLDGVAGPVTVSVGLHGRRPARPGSVPEMAADMVAAAERVLDASRAHGPGRIEIEP